MTGKTHPIQPDPGERGAAMLLIATLLIALLAGGGVALYLQLQSTKSAGMVKAARTSLYCAEAGLAASRGIIALNYLTWPTALDASTSNDPPWYPLVGDIDGDGVDDYEVRIRDNDDEVPPAPNDPERDNDRQVFAVAHCIKNTEVSREVVELLLVASSGHVYRNQSGGGAFSSGNQNPQ
ncbi:MAG TPA: hypothetical protein VK698_28950 [Kofleriaceae bacterium]|nr:hypothetical protein [Kofleriaceae bacterium]